MQWGPGGVSFPGKSVTKVYCSTLLALRGVDGGQISRKKALRNTWMAPYANHLMKQFSVQTRFQHGSLATEDTRLHFIAMAYIMCGLYRRVENFKSKIQIDLANIVLVLVQCKSVF